MSVYQYTHRVVRKVMARFAHDCVLNFNRLTKELADTLGAGKSVLRNLHPPTSPLDRFGFAQTPQNLEFVSVCTADP